MAKKKKKKGSRTQPSSTLPTQEELESSQAEEEEPAESPQEEETKKRSDSDTSTGSVSSINYIVTPELREASGILKIPVVSIRLEKGDTANENKLLLKIGDERPDTTILKGQGRHVSAYVLYREAMINRINGQDVESVGELLKDFLAEYIETGGALNQFAVYMKLHQDKSGETKFDKEERKAIYQAEKETKEFLAEDLPPELQISELPANVQEFLAKLQSVKERWAAVQTQPMERRNQLKQGNIFSYQIPIIEAMKGVLTIFNKMEQGAFEDKRTLSAEQRQREGSSQGGKLSGMVIRIRSGYLDEDGVVDTDKMQEHLYNTFDYPYDEISKQFDPKTNPFDVDKHFYQVVRRHIKLFFDTIPKDKPLNDKNRAFVCMTFLQDVLEKGKWYQLLSIGKRGGAVTKAELGNLMSTVYSKLNWDGKRFQLTQKFSALLPKPLQTAVTDLEQLIHVEEEKEEAAKKVADKGEGAQASSSTQAFKKTR